MSLFLNDYDDLRGVWIAVIVAIPISLFVYGGIKFRFYQHRYHMTATYCSPAKHCVYRDRNQRENYCLENWDNSGVFDKVNNLKLDPSTCKIQDRE